MLKMYGKKTVLTACVSLFLILPMLSAMTASASPYVVGVKIGDWAGYGDIFLEWESNIPGQEEPPPEFSNMSWADMKVLDIFDGNITVRSTTIYKNGTERIDVTSGNITSGEGELSVSIIPSNLGAGDEIPANLTWYTEEPLKLVINGTITRNYANANREVNYVNITLPVIYGTMNMSFYWDKNTGILCEEIYSYVVSFTSNSKEYYMSMLMMFRMTATNMWPAVFPIDWNGYIFNATMISNSSISSFNFTQAEMEISFNVTGPAGKAGYCNVTIPKDMLQGSPWTVLLNGTDWTTLCTITENDTHTFIHIPYTHSTNTIQIRGTWVIPEFPPAMILPLLMIATTVSAILFRRRRKT